MQQEDNPNQNPQIPQPPIVNQPVPAMASQQPLENQQVQTPTSTPIYAGFWVRWAAFQIDFLPFSIFFALLNRYVSKDSVFSSAGTWVGITILFLYFIIFTFINGSTPGKMLFKVKVTDHNGNKPNLLKAILREVIGKIISILILFLGFLWIVFDKKKQGLHDKIASTQVILLEPLSGFRKVMVGIFKFLFILELALSVLGIIAAAALIGINPANKQAQARDSVRRSDILQIRDAASNYYLRDSKDKYPSSLQDLVASGDLKQVLTDPMGGQYYYKATEDGYNFVAYANLESGSKGVYCYVSIGSGGSGKELSSASECVPR